MPAAACQSGLGRWGCSGTVRFVPDPALPLTLARPNFRGQYWPKVGGTTVGAIAIAGILFVAVFCGALLGMLFRRLLPNHHLSDGSKEIVRLCMGLVATMTALVLGLLIGSANSSYQSQRSEFERMSANLMLLDFTLAHYGPEAKEARALLHRTIALTFERIWPESDSQSSSLAAPEAMAAAGAFYDAVQALSPRTDVQRRLQSQALQISADAGRTRWLLIGGQDDSAIPTPFLVVLVFWLSALFASFGLFPPANATVIAVLFVCALSVSGAVFLILELDRPYDGLIRISDASLRNVLAQLSQ